MIKIYGKNCVYEAIRKKARMEVFIEDNQVKKDKNILSLLNDKGYKYEVLTKRDMDKKFGMSHQGYGALREDYEIYDEEFLNTFKKEQGRVLILDGIQDPHNLGAILRSVDAFGFDLVILPKNRSVMVTEVVAHVSTGAIEYTKIVYVNSLNQAVLRLKENGFWICGTDALGTVRSSEIDPSLSLAVIIGSEGFGMSKTLVKESDYLITIPMMGHVNSLNASVSAGIVLHDLCLKK